MKYIRKQLVLNSGTTDNPEFHQSTRVGQYIPVLPYSEAPLPEQLIPAYSSCLATISIQSGNNTSFAHCLKRATNATIFMVPYKVSVPPMITGP